MQILIRRQHGLQLLDHTLIPAKEILRFERVEGDVGVDVVVVIAVVVVVVAVAVVVVVAVAVVVVVVAVV